MEALPAAPRHRYQWADLSVFIAFHLAALGAFLVPWTARSVGLLLGLYLLRMFAVTAGYHRYFAHRTFKTSRWFQLALAFLAETSLQRGALWWAAHHRKHHKYSDLPGDLHSPLRDGFWHSHLLWIYDHNDATDTKRIEDFARFPELRFLDRHWQLPAWVLGIACYLIAGPSGLLVSFFLGTVILWHATFTINSLAHVWGARRFPTTDTSRNNLWLALLTLGEGWHNNHHHYQSSARQGFYWWEVDVTYYVLRALSLAGVVRDLRETPERVLAEGRALDARRRRERASAPSEPLPVALPEAP
ncbi:MAG: fatty acid desaturase [Deltaproteobacteria bacterium]|nr:fatty acid desaturase [Deltaproteobacteria bacterium]